MTIEKAASSEFWKFFYGAENVVILSKVEYDSLIIKDGKTIYLIRL